MAGKHRQEDCRRQVEENWDKIRGFDRRPAVEVDITWRIKRNQVYLQQHWHIHVWLTAWESTEFIARAQCWIASKLVPSLFPDLKTFDSASTQHLHWAIQTVRQQASRKQINQVVRRNNEAVHANSRRRVQQGYEKINQLDKHHQIIFAVTWYFYWHFDACEQ